jgi:hypothetical protein
MINYYLCRGSIDIKDIMAHINQTFRATIHDLKSTNETLIVVSPFSFELGLDPDGIYLVCPTTEEEEWVILQKLKGNVTKTYKSQNYLKSETDALQIIGNELVPLEKIS